MTHPGRSLFLPARGVPSVPPLPSSAEEYWISDKQCTSASWIGQLKGTTLPSQAGSPTVATDPPYFNGALVAKTVRGAAHYRNEGLATTLCLANDPIWFYTVARLPSPSATNETFLCNGRFAGPYYQQQVYQSTHTLAYAPGNIRLQGAPIDALPHRIMSWTDASAAYHQVDANLAQNTSPYPIPAPISFYVIGGTWGSGSGSCPINMVFHLLCRSKPAAAAIDALDAWSHAKYGVL